MLTLAEASTFFDRTEVCDVNTGRRLFYGQLEPFDDSKRDSGSAYRRTLALKPGTVLPGNLTVVIFGQTFILGNKELDGLENLHREKVTLQMCSGLFSIHRLNGFVTSNPASYAWGSAQWLKDSKETGASSEVAQVYNIVLPLNSDVREHDILSDGPLAYIVQASRPMPSGFMAAEAVQLDYAKGQASITRRVYNAVTGVYASLAPVTAMCARVRWQNLFENRAEPSAAYKDGDDTLVFPSGTVLDTSSLIAFDGGLWSVVSVDNLGGAVTVHARRSWAT